MSYELFDKYGPQMIADLCEDFHFTPAQAAGFVGNGGGESAGFTDIVEDGAIKQGMAGGTGWFQWTGPRRRVFEAWIARHEGWKATDYEANYSFLFRELKGSEAHVVPLVLACKTVEEATRVVWEKYERPGDAVKGVKNYGASLPARTRWARRALERYEATKPAPSAWTGKAPQPKSPSIAVPEVKDMDKNLIPIITGVVLNTLNNISQGGTVPTTPQVAKEVAQDVAKTPEIQHVTNTETAWYQQRSKWAAIFAGLGAAVGGVTTAGVLPGDYVTYATTAATILSGLGGFFGLRAGQATRPLFSN